MSRKKVYALAKELGATIEDATAGDTHHFNIDAPKGFVWSSDGGLHCLVASCHKGGNWTGEMWEDVLGRMTFGLEPCTDYGDGDCEICNEERQMEYGHG